MKLHCNVCYCGQANKDRTLCQRRGSAAGAGALGAVLSYGCSDGEKKDTSLHMYVTTMLVNGVPCPCDV